MTSTTTSTERDFALFPVLASRVEAAGLFEPVYGTYLKWWMFWSVMLGVCIVALAIAPTWWERIILLAPITAAVLLQFEYMAHDAGHREVFPGKEDENIYFLLVLTILIGISGDWWTKAHNGHHTHPNHEKDDPNLRVGILAFSRSQWLAKGRIGRFFVKYQAFYYPFAVMFETIMMIQNSFKHIFSRNYRTWKLELLCMGAHFVVHFGVLVWILGWEAIPFTIVFHLALGFYLGMVFAPNHKGMRVILEGEEVSFLEEQLTTTRNVRPGFLTDFVMGGLNYQVEHHLFPQVSRHRFRELRVIVKQFCEENDLFYYETSLWESWLQMARFWHSAGSGNPKTMPYEWQYEAA